MRKKFKLGEPGGKARMAALTREQRSAFARQGYVAGWGKAALRRRKLTDKQRESIRKALARGVKPNALAQQYKVSRSLISRVKNKER